MRRRRSTGDFREGEGEGEGEKYGEGRRRRRRSFAPTLDQTMVRTNEPIVRSYAIIDAIEVLIGLYLSVPTNKISTASIQNAMQIWNISIRLGLPVYRACLHV